MTHTLVCAPARLRVPLSPAKAEPLCTIPGLDESRAKNWRQFDPCTVTASKGTLVLLKNKTVFKKQTMSLYVTFCVFRNRPRRVVLVQWISLVGLTQWDQFRQKQAQTGFVCTCKRKLSRKRSPPPPPRRGTPDGGDRFLESFLFRKISRPPFLEIFLWPDGHEPSPP